MQITAFGQGRAVLLTAMMLSAFTCVGVQARLSAADSLPVNQLPATTQWWNPNNATVPLDAWDLTVLWISPTPPANDPVVTWNDQPTDLANWPLLVTASPKPTSVDLILRQVLVSMQQLSSCFTQTVCSMALGRIPFLSDWLHGDQANQGQVMQQVGC